MRTIKQQLSRMSPLSAGIVLLFAATMTYLLIQSFAAVGPANLYTSPGGTKTVNKDSTFTVSVRISTASDVPVTGAAVYMSYPTSKLTFQNVSYSGSPYNLELLESNSGGVLRMERGALPAIPGGDKLFAKVTFKAVSSGSAAISFTSSSYVTSGEDDSNLPLQVSGVTYNIVTPSSGGDSSSGSNNDSSDSSSDTNSNSSNTSSQSPSSEPSVSQESPDSSESSSTNDNKKDKDSNSPSSHDTNSSDNTNLSRALEVVVTDEGQNPVRGAKVTIDGETIETDENGIARFEYVPAGEQDIVVDHNGVKTLSTVQVEGLSTVSNPESFVVTIDSNKLNPLIWLVVPLIGMFIIALMLFGRPWINKNGGFLSYFNKHDKDTALLNTPLAHNNPKKDINSFKAKNTPPPGSTYRPETERKNDQGELSEQRQSMSDPKF